MSEEAFTQRVMDTLTQGFVSAGIAMGKRLGLFDGLAKLSQTRESAVTSAQLAEELQYRERYVREWLNALVCGDVIDHVEIEGEDRYWIASYKVATLVGEGCPAINSELLAGVLSNARNVEKCFAVDGPLGRDVDEYPGLHDFLAKHSTPWADARNVKDLLADASLIKLLESGGRVLEIGCGGGVPIKAMASVFPNSSFVASDISEQILDKAKLNCKDLPNVTYEVLDACNVPSDREDRFDLIMLFDVFHDVSYPSKLLAGVLQLLNEGGLFLMSDLDMFGSVQENKTKCAGAGSALYIVSCLYCVPTSLRFPGGAGLGACCGPQAIEQLLNESGLTDVTSSSTDLGRTFRATKSSEVVTSKKAKTESSKGT
ncbi:S-adenosylmethionine-dependent methyltransferase Rv2258c-like isoform X1 [Watersipora subatra]|uniref:S-adenosylmethionine-dependent methyltransferase Rv2258c-like isoform X1 n=1 Tax=Watersipora subatra TaxID=2589382 RepID=UPI00355AEEFA